MLRSRLFAYIVDNARLLVNSAKKYLNFLNIFSFFYKSMLKYLQKYDTITMCVYTLYVKGGKTA